MTCKTFAILTLTILTQFRTTAQAGDVHGIVTMPSYCSPEISPAVVWLIPEPDPRSEKAEPPKPGHAEDASTVRQVAMQFTPRVTVLQAGDMVRFTNEGSDFHNINVQARGELFNQTMPPGQIASYVPASTGIMSVFCNIHQHMRAFLIVQDTPWITACSPKGTYRFRNVPAGKYRMYTWHEMGQRPAFRSIEVKEAGLEVETIALSDATAAPGKAALLAKPASNAWPETIDRISVRLASAIGAAKRPETANRAQTIADETFRIDYRPTELATAIRTHLGEARAKAIEEKFTTFSSEIRGSIASGGKEPSKSQLAMRGIIASLFEASEDLKSKGISDIQNSTPREKSVR
jgi:high-affinity iron transporter